MNPIGVSQTFRWTTPPLTAAISYEGGKKLGDNTYLRLSFFVRGYSMYRQRNVATAVLMRSADRSAVSKVQGPDRDPFGSASRAPVRARRAGGRAPPPRTGHRQRQPPPSGTSVQTLHAPHSRFITRRAPPAHSAVRAGRALSCPRHARERPGFGPSGRGTLPPWARRATRRRPHRPGAARVPPRRARARRAHQRLPTGRHSARGGARA
eukprot:3174939-Prymnesium_polylepis.1